MLNKLREKRHILLRVKIPIGEIIRRIEDIRRENEVLAVCPEVTGNNYQGVKSATLGLFPANTLVIPQYYSNSVYSLSELNKISSAIIDFNFKTIVFSGVPKYASSIIQMLNARDKTRATQLCFIYHGSLASNSEYGKATSDYLQWLLTLAATKQIDRLGFVKKGMSELFASLQNINSNHLLLKTAELNFENEIPGKNEIQIGVLGSNHYRKNFHNQVAAALLFKDAKVHVKQSDELKYLNSQDRIMAHPYFSDHNNFLKLLASMSINFYVTFSECWGQLITESLAAGVPCLATNNSGIFDYDDFLREQLIVEDFDNPISIYKQALKALENRNEISRRCIDYVHQLNNKAELLLQEFIHF